VTILVAFFSSVVPRLHSNKPADAGQKATAVRFRIVARPYEE
jgi:hypothetical protein